VPELPEVETARTLIADQALHRRIVDVDDSDSYVGRPHAPGELRSALTGRSLTAAHRRGKTMWLETSGTPDAAQPGPELGIHLGMSGRIVVTGPDGAVAERGDPHRYDTRPRRAVWSRFTLTFADGGSLVLFDPRRLGRVRLNPDIGALGPDAAEVTPAEFRALMTKGTIAVKARLLDQSKIAGRRDSLASQGVAPGAGRPPLLCAGQSPLPGAEVGPGVRHRQGRCAHRRRYRGPPSGRYLPAGRRPDGARNGRRAVHVVVLARAGPPAGRAAPSEIGLDGRAA
jgi:formamidopyrimidine-DNA glycosylase